MSVSFAGAQAQAEGEHALAAAHLDPRKGERIVHADALLGGGRTEVSGLAAETRLAIAEEAEGVTEAGNADAEGGFELFLASGDLAAGFLVAKEVGVLKQLTETPERPYVVVLGGAKVADKLSVIENLLKVADTLVIGGGMTFTFLKAQGKSIGSSLLDESNLDTCLGYLETAKAQGKQILLPIELTVRSSTGPAPITTR